MINDTQVIFLNAEGKKDGIDKELSEFLDYVKTNIPSDAFTRKLEDAVADVNKDEEWRKAIMTLAMRDLENQQKGRLEGMREGRLEGQLDMVVRFVKTGLVSIQDAAEIYGVTEDELSVLIEKA